MPTSSAEVGEISDESFIFQKVVWKIPHFFSLPKAKGHTVKSPSFSFANTTWRLFMDPKDLKFDNVYVGIEIYKSLGLEHTIFYKIFIETRNGLEFKSFSDCIDSDGDWRVKRFLSSYSELNTQRNLISSNGTVAIICEMRAKKISVSDAYSQTELSETLGSNEDKVESPTAVHVNKLLQNFQELLLSEEDSDVIIQMKNRKFRAHRAILKARSSVFESMFRNDMKEKATGVVEVEDCDPDSFPDFLHYLYGGKVDKLSDQNVFSLYATSDKYDVQELKSECLKFMKNNLSVDTLFDTIRLCLRYSEAELLKLATDFFAKNLPKIIVTVKWQVFLAENITYGNELLVKALVPDNKINQ